MAEDALWAWRKEDQRRREEALRKALEGITPAVFRMCLVDRERGLDLLAGVLSGKPGPAVN